MLLCGRTVITEIHHENKISVSEKGESKMGLRCLRSKQNENVVILEAEFLLSTCSPWSTLVKMMPLVSLPST